MKGFCLEKCEKSSGLEKPETGKSHISDFLSVVGVAAGGVCGEIPRGERVEIDTARHRLPDGVPAIPIRGTGRSPVKPRLLMPERQCPNEHAVCKQRGDSAVCE